MFAARTSVRQSLRRSKRRRRRRKRECERNQTNMFEKRKTIEKCNINFDRFRYERASASARAWVDWMSGCYHDAGASTLRSLLNGVHSNFLPFDDDDGSGGNGDPNALECLRCYYLLMMLLLLFLLSMWCLLTLIPTYRRWIWWQLNQIMCPMYVLG